MISGLQGATFQQLLNNGKVFSVDYRPLSPYVEASPNTNLQLPVVVFAVISGRFQVLSIT